MNIFLFSEFRVSVLGLSGFVWIDLGRWFGSGPTMTIVGLVLGVLIAMRSVRIRIRSAFGVWIASGSFGFGV